MSSYSKNVFFTSDLHIGHRKIIEYCDRPFSCHEDMVEALVKNWNERVKKNDDIYILGDFIMYGSKQALEIVKRFTGKKYIIRGNHDTNSLKGEYAAHFVWVKDLKEIQCKDDDLFLDVNETRHFQPIMLSHYPFLTWNKRRYGSWNLHGHTHFKTPQTEITVKRVDVGVDAWGFKPVEYSEVRALVKKNEEFVHNQFK